MRKALASIALAAVAGYFTLGIAACSTLVSADSLKPRDARSAYAEAEILFVGVINTTDILAARGVLSGEQVGALLPTFATVAETLDGAFKLLKAGETISALAKIDFARADLDRLANALSRAAEAGAPAGPTPSPTNWHPVTI